AEDGIRDRNVTGVQTCALPICKNPTFIPNKKEAFKLPYCFLFEKLEKLHYLMLPQHSRNQYYSYLAIPLDDYLNTPITKSTFLYAYEHLQHFLDRKSTRLNSSH